MYCCAIGELDLFWKVLKDLYKVVHEDIYSKTFKHIFSFISGKPYYGDKLYDIIKKHIGNKKMKDI